MKNGITVIVVVVVLLLAQGGLFVVNEAEQAIVTQFGKPVSDIIHRASTSKFLLCRTSDVLKAGF